MIRVDHLSKHYRVHARAAGLKAALASVFSRPTSLVRAVEDLSFSIAAGERVGFLGPNGAGKTTTLKLLSGLLYPTQGKVEVDGHSPHRRDVEFLKKIMLVMGQKQQLLWDLPPLETFELNRAIYDVPRADFKRRVDGLITLLEIDEVVRKPTRNLSLGERMKCELAAALVHGPKVLFLDEPTIGLDVSMQVVMRDFIRRYNETEGATLMLTSHYMDDVAALCPRVIVIDRGQLSFDGRLEDLVARVSPDKRIQVRWIQPVPEERLAGLGQIVAHSAIQATFRVGPKEVNRVVATLLQNLPVADLTVENPPLEEVMSELFRQGRAARSAEAA